MQDSGDDSDGSRSADDPTISAGAAAALFAPIAPLTAFEETIDRLGAAIRLGILKPESRLPPERQLAQAFDISRTTLRQAIVALVQAGLLTTKRGRSGGTWVVPDPPAMTTGPPEEDCTDVLDMRLAIEAGCALLAAHHATESVLRGMDEICDELNVIVSTEREYSEYRQLDVQFHLLLAEGAESTQLLAQMAEVQDGMSRLAGVKRWPTMVLSRANQQHRAVVNALRAHDGGRAAEVLFEHIEGSRLILRGMTVD
ncbi:MAG: FadR/GntR family transcriptional regulator [Thermomicrobiales bacterium]